MAGFPRGHLLAGAAGIALVAVGIAAADDAADWFEMSFGPRLKQVRSTADAADDLRLAGELLEAARDNFERTRRLELLCDHAYELAAAHAEGHAVAEEAMRLLADGVPVARAGALDAIARLRREQFRLANPEERDIAGRQLIDALLAAGEALQRIGELDRAVQRYRTALDVAAAIRFDDAGRIRQRLETAVARRRLREQIDRLEADLHRRPDDIAAARQLVRLYIIAMDDPQRARPHAAKLDDPRWRLNVPLAAADIADLREEEALRLADWYHDLAREAPPVARPAMLERAYRYAQRFLELHEPRDETRRRVQMIQAQARAALEQMGRTPPPTGALALRPPPPAPPAEPPAGDGGRLRAALRAPLSMRRIAVADERIDLLAILRLDDRGRDHPWRRDEAGNIEARAEDADRMDAVMLPVRPDGGYELSLDLELLRGDGLLRLLLPAGEGAAEMVVPLSRSTEARFLLKEQDDAGHREASGDDAITHRSEPSPDQGVRGQAPGHHFRGQALSLRARVEVLDQRASMTAVVNGRTAARWSGPLSELRADPRWGAVPAGAPAVGLQRAAAPGDALSIRFTAMELRVLHGQASMLEAMPEQASDAEGGLPR